MKLDEFIKNFAFALEKDASQFTAATRFKEADGWDSLNALSVIAMIDERYGITIAGDDLQVATTVEDLCKLVQERAGASANVQRG